MSAIKLKEVQSILVRCYTASVNAFLRGKPGIGKTQTINAFVQEMQKRVPDFKAWMFYAPTMSPMDIQASAPDYEQGVLRLYNNAALPNAYVDPDAKGVIFFGELPNADQATTKLLQKYVNGEDMSGVLKKPAGIMVVADGNRIEDKSSVQQQGRAFLSRFMQFEVYTDADDNRGYAAAQSWHPHVQTFFQENPALIDNYDEVFETTASARSRKDKAAGADHMSEEGRNGIWANMRAWERNSMLEQAAEELKSSLTLAEIAGNVGQAVAAQYEAHKKMLGSLVSFSDIMADPAKAKLPEKISEQYSLCMLVALRCTEDQIGKVRQFGTRMPPELQIVIIKTMHTRRGFNYKSTKDYLEWIVDKEVNSLLTAR